MNYLLEYKEDQSFGTKGFYIHGATLNSDQYSMATEGSLVAHDIMEHQRIKDIGGIGDELKAMGAIWYIRGQFGDFPNSIRTPQDNIASDITRMARDFNFSPYFECEIPRKYTHYLDETFLEIMDKAKSDLKHELEPEDRNSKYIDEYFACVLPLMLEGFDQVSRRFDKIGGAMAANRVYHTISRAVDGALEHAEIEGQRFNLRINFTNNTATCEESYNDEDYY